MIQRETTESHYFDFGSESRNQSSDRSTMVYSLDQFIFGKTIAVLLPNGRATTSVRRLLPLTLRNLKARRVTAILSDSRCCDAVLIQRLQHDSIAPVQWRLPENRCSLSSQLPKMSYGLLWTCKKKCVKIIIRNKKRFHQFIILMVNWFVEFYSLILFLFI